MSYRIIEVIDYSHGDADDGVDRDLDSEMRAIAPTQSFVPIHPTDRLWRIVDFVRSQARHLGGSIHCLRIHGHGDSGWFLHGLLTAETIRETPTLRQLRRLREIFDHARKCETHLMGCRIASGDDGRLLLQGMADALGVPVTAGYRTQWGGRASTFSFEGPTLTAHPGGQRRRSAIFTGRYSGGAPAR